MLRKNLKFLGLLVFALILINGDKSIAQPAGNFYVMPSFQDFSPPRGPISGKEFRMMEMGGAVTTGKKTPWVVYADRNDIDTYKSPEKRTTLKKINFMEAFFVVSSVDNGKMLQIVSYNADIFDFNTQKFNERFQESRDYYGWVESDNLLLWENSLLDPVGRTSIKAFSTFSPAMFSDISHFVSDYSIKVYKSPDLSDKLDYYIQPFTYYFLYKESGNSYLIGQDDKITPAIAKRKILGWVPRQAVHLWKQKLCLEINPDNRSITERKANKISPCIYLTSDDAIKSKINSDVPKDHILMEYSADEKWSGFNSRLPVLGSDSGEIFKTAFVTDLFGHSDDLNELRNGIHSSGKEGVVNSNVVFVVCGNDNIRSAYSKIAYALTDVAERFNKSHREGGANDYSLKVGCVIFNREMQEHCQVSPSPLNLTQNYAQLSNYLNDIQQRPNDCNYGNNSDEPMSLYSGIQAALEVLKGHEEENNHLVIIGDAGSTLMAVNRMEEGVVSGLSGLKCNLLVIQSGNPGTEVYDNFYRQSKRIAESTVIRVNKLSDEFRAKTPLIEKRNNYNSASTGWDIFEYAPSTSALSGRFVLATESGTITSDLIKDNLSYVLSWPEKNRRSELQSTSSNGIFKPGIKKLLSEAGLNTSDPKFEKQFGKYPFMMEGYTSLKSDGLESNLYKLNVFVSQQEMVRIVNMLKRLTSADEQSEVRKVLTEAFRQAAEDYFVYTADKSFLLNKSLDEILFMINGVHSKNSIFKKYKIADINNSKKLSDADLKILTNVFQTKKEKLNVIVSNINYHFEMDGNVFYWIPEECLP